MLWHSILPSQIFCKYTPEGVAKLATPSEHLTKIIYFSRSRTDNVPLIPCVFVL